MAWGSNTNLVNVGDATKKVHYDNLWDKLQYIKDSVIPAATKMLFGQSAAPSGWTKDTATWTTDSMIVFTTGAIGSGGSVAAQSHIHTGPSHYHKWYDVIAGEADDKDGSGTDLSATTPGTTGLYYMLAMGDKRADDGLAVDMNTSSDGTGASGAANALYQTVIAATKDTYT